jgi:hypothetical protein
MISAPQSSTFEVDQESGTLFALFSTTCTSPPQPYDKKLCSRFLPASMELALSPDSLRRSVS